CSQAICQAFREPRTTAHNHSYLQQFHKYLCNTWDYPVLSWTPDRSYVICTGLYIIDSCCSLYDSDFRRGAATYFCMEIPCRFCRVDDSPTFFFEETAMALPVHISRIYRTGKQASGR